MAEVGKQEDCGPDQPGQKARPYLQNNKSKRAGGVAQLAECLSSKPEALNLNSHIAKKHPNQLMHACHPSYAEVDTGGLQFEAR
jgi:hypothetical protein